MSAPDGVAVFIVAFWTLIFVKALVGYRRTDRPLPNTTLPPPSVSVYVPARNEVEVVGDCLESLLADAAIDKVVVMDDGSDDGTQTILHDLKGRNPDRLSFLAAPGPVGGACGKPSALAYGVAQRPSDGEWLLFVDADVVLAPGSVATLAELAQSRGWDLVSAIPYQELHSVLEKIVMPSIGALLLGAHPPAKVADKDSPLVFANGQVLLVRRAAYEAVGGHAEVAFDVLEDVGLARLIKRAGYTVSWVDGRKLAKTRMYNSWQELSEGWSKNLWLLLGRRSLVWVPLALIAGSAGYIAAAVAGWPLGCAAFLTVTLMQAWLRYLGRAAPQWAWAAPLGAIGASLLLWKSYRRHAGDRVQWKGRSYAGASRQAALARDRNDLKGHGESGRL